MIKLYFKMMWKIMRFCLPILLLLLPVLAITGMFVSWAPDQEIIQDNYPRHMAVLSGYSHQTTVSGGSTTSYTQRSYWLLPKSIESPKMLAITYNNQIEAKHEATTSGFWFAVICYILIAALCYFIWVRGYDPFNKAKHNAR